MRVPDVFLKSVAYICEVTDLSLPTEDRDPQATGFIVSIPSAKLAGSSYLALVTSRHVVTGLNKLPINLLVNLKQGGRTTLRIENTTWYLHDDPTVDLALTPIIGDASLDIAAISISTLV